MHLTSNFQPGVFESAANFGVVANTRPLVTIHHDDIIQVELAHISKAKHPSKFRTCCERHHNFLR